MDRLPKIAEVHCTPIQFQPGDRVLVRVPQQIDKDQRARIRKTVEQWAGGFVEVLVYCPEDFEITIEKGENSLGVKSQIG